MANNYTFNGSEGEPIDLKTTREWTANYRREFPDETKAHFFGFEILQKILKQDRCMGIRIYYALNEKGEKQLILTGATADGNNQLPATLEFNAADPNTIADASYPCPSFCAGNDFN